MTGMVKQSTKPGKGQKRLKGPEDRVRELEALRKQVAKKKFDAKAGYDPEMQLHSIDHEIARLKGKKTYTRRRK
jgi:hypothetical protein